MGALSSVLAQIQAQQHPVSSPGTNYIGADRNDAIPVFQDKTVDNGNQYDPSSDSWAPGGRGVMSGAQQALGELIRKNNIPGNDGMGYKTALELFTKDPNWVAQWNQQYPGTLPMVGESLNAMGHQWANKGGGGAFTDAIPLILAIAGGAMFSGAGIAGEAIPASAAGVGVEGGVGAASGAAGAGGAAAGTGSGVGFGGGEGVQQVTQEALGGGLRAGTTTGAVGGSELGTGLTAGTTAGGVGGGNLGTGITAAAGAAGLGALGQGSFAGETVTPVIGGASTAAGSGLPGQAGSGAVAGSGAAAGSAISRILDGTASTADWTSVLGTAAATGVGIYGANEQANKLKEIADRLYATGAPSRGRYEASFDPGFTMANDPGYQGALDTTTDTLLRRASVGGNPVGNPGVLAEIAKYVTGNVALPALQNYRTQNANTGGYSSFNTAAPTTATNAVNAGANVYGDVGYGIGQATNPRPQFSLSDIYRSTLA